MRPAPPPRYHKTNAGLELLISNLKLKQAGLQQEVLLQRSGKSDAAQMLKNLQHDLQAVGALGGCMGRCACPLPSVRGRMLKNLQHDLQAVVAK